jgi:hypothetical protein
MKRAVALRRVAGKKEDGEETALTVAILVEIGFPRSRDVVGVTVIDMAR